MEHLPLVSMEIVPGTQYGTFFRSPRSSPGAFQHLTCIPALQIGVMLHQLQNDNKAKVCTCSVQAQLVF